MFRRMRYLIIASTVLVLCGVILVAGSLFKEPYTVMERVRVDKAKTWVDDAFVLMRFENRTFYLDSVGENRSIIQVDVDSSDFIVFKIISRVTDEIFLERETRWDVTSYWTPPSLGHGTWRFVFQNPSSTQVDVTVRAREFFLKATEYRDVTYYRSVLDPFYGYNGIIAIIAGIALNIVHVLKKRDEGT
jgi:hypothetical protein